MSGCVLWEGATAGNGYGVVSVGGKQLYAHRLAAEQAYGPIPAGMVVAHICDTPACVNPGHLFVCTQAENLADMRRKGRAAAGERHRTKTKPELVLKGEQIGNSKLTEETVRAIRAEYQPAPAGRRSPTSLASIAAKYGIAFQTVHKIVKGKLWKHL